MVMGMKRFGKLASAASVGALALGIIGTAPAQAAQYWEVRVPNQAQCVALTAGAKVGLAASGYKITPIYTCTNKTVDHRGTLYWGSFRYSK